MKGNCWAIWIALAAALAAASVRAQQPDPKREQLAAATARAVDRLRLQIAQEQLGRNVTVGEVLRATGGSDALIKTLERAQMIGGPRWLDDQTCQVRLDISGPRVAQALIQIVNTRPKKSPIDPEVLQERLKQWNGRTFSATSTSTGSAGAEQARPVEAPAAWARVTDADRQKAISAAKRSAGGEVLRAIKPIAISDGKTIADAMEDPAIRSSVYQWLGSRPVTQIEFEDDLEVAVTIATPAAELAELMINAAGVPEAERERVRAELAGKVPSAARGTARAGLPSATRPAIVLPSQPPAWTNDQLDAEGSGSAKDSPLKAARAAEADAQAKLRVKIDALPLAAGQTVAQAAKQDPRIADAIARVVSQARAAKVDYLRDGSARVRVSVRLSDLWDAIAAAL